MLLLARARGCCGQVCCQRGRRWCWLQLQPLLLLLLLLSLRHPKKLEQLAIQRRCLLL